MTTAIDTAAIALNALNEFLRQASAVSALITQTRSEGRPISLGELRQVVSERNTAIANLDAAIDRAELG